MVGVGAGAACLGTPPPWPTEEMNATGSASTTEPEDEEDEFGAIPKPMDTIPEWYSEWAKHFVLPLMIRGNLGLPGDPPTSWARPRTIVDPWAVLAEMSGRTLDDIPGRMVCALYSPFL